MRFKSKVITRAYGPGSVAELATMLITYFTLRMDKA